MVYLKGFALTSHGKDIPVDGELCRWHTCFCNTTGPHTHVLHREKSDSIPDLYDPREKQHINIPTHNLYAQTHKQPVTTSFTSHSAIRPNPPLEPPPSTPTAIWFKHRQQFNVSEKTDEHKYGQESTWKLL